MPAYPEHCSLKRAAGVLCRLGLRPIRPRLTLQETRHVDYFTPISFLSAALIPASSTASAPPKCPQRSAENGWRARSAHGPVALQQRCSLLMTARSRAYDAAPSSPKRLFRDFCTPRTPQGDLNLSR